MTAFSVLRCFQNCMHHLGILTHSKANHNQPYLQGQTSQFCRTCFCRSRTLTMLTPLVFSASTVVSRNAARLLQLVCFGPLASKDTSAPKPGSANMAPNLQLPAALHQAYMIPGWGQQATGQPWQSATSASPQYELVMHILNQRLVTSCSTHCEDSIEPPSVTGMP